MCGGGGCESDDMDLDGDDWEDMDNNMLDFGAVVGGRYTIDSQISIIGTYYFGLTEWGDDMGWSNRSFQINLAYVL